MPPMEYRQNMAKPIITAQTGLNSLPKVDISDKPTGY